MSRTSRARTLPHSWSSGWDGRWRTPRSWSGPGTRRRRKRPRTPDWTNGGATKPTTTRTKPRANWASTTSRLRSDRLASTRQPEPSGNSRRRGGDHGGAESALAGERRHHRLVHAGAVRLRRDPHAWAPGRIVGEIRVGGQRVRDQPERPNHRRDAHVLARIAHRDAVARRIATRLHVARHRAGL